MSRLRPGTHEHEHEPTRALLAYFVLVCRMRLPVTLSQTTDPKTSSASRTPSVPNLDQAGTGTIADRRASHGLPIPKNRSFGNLIAHANRDPSFAPDAQSQRGRLSVDAGVDYDMARCVPTGPACQALGLGCFLAAFTGHMRQTGQHRQLA